MKAPKKNLITAALLAAPALASALGLGGINVKSGLNQPLEAEIPVSINSPAERESLIVTLANADDYARVGIDARGLSVPLEFAVTKDGKGDTVIRVTSKEAIREPFLQLLLQVNWNNGKLLREYSLLIDPPVMAPALRGSQAVSAPVKEQAPVMVSEPMAAKPETVTKPMVEAKPVAEAKPAAEVKPAAAATQPKLATEMKPTPAPAAPGTVTTKSGDSLYLIANSNKPSPSTNIDQMMVAILRMNPQAFYQNNVNALKKGQILRMPGAEDLKQTSAAQASLAVREQNALWRGYQQSAAAQPTTMADPGVSTATASGASGNNGARLELLPPKSDDNGKALSAANAEAARAREELVSREREASELRARVSELERLKADQERVVALKDDQLAELTKQLQEARKAADAAASAAAIASATKATPPPVETPTEVTTPVETTAATDTTTSTDTTTPADATTEPVDTTATTDGTETKPADDIWGEQPADDAAATTDLAATDTTTDPNAVVADPNAEPADGTTVTPVTEPEVTSEPTDATTETGEPATTSEPVEEAKPWYMNPITWGVAGVGVLGALALLFGRKKKPKVSAPSPSFADSDVNFGIPAIGSGAATAFGSDFAAHDEDESRIRSAIAANPNDLWAHLDLLRLYYSRQDSANFEAAASTMFGFVIDQESPQWQEAKTMGMQLIPGNSLFAAAPDFGSMDAHVSAFEAAPAKPTPAPPSAPTMVNSPFQDEPLGSLDLGAFEDSTASSATVVSTPLLQQSESSNADFSFDLDLDSPTKVMEPIRADTPAPKDDFNFDFSFDAPAPTPASPSRDVAPNVAPALDVGKIALEDVVPAPLDNVADLSNDDFMIGDDSVGTKLDLARAYLDMGDPDGARSMLEEVLSEGSDTQRNEAKQLLGRIV